MTTPLSDNRFLPQDTGFKHWSCFCPPQTPAKKLAMVPSLQPAFLKMPMAPTFLSSSNTRRHNNARPHPLHTLLSAAAERSSYGLYFQIWTSRKLLYLGPPKQHKKSAAEGYRLLRLLFCLLYRCSLGIQIKKCRLASYLMEHICFEAQLCSRTSIFKETLYF